MSKLLADKKHRKRKALPCTLEDQQEGTKKRTSGALEGNLSPSPGLLNSFCRDPESEISGQQFSGNKRH